MNSAARTYLIAGLLLLAVGIVMVFTGTGHKGLAYGDILVALYMLLMFWNNKDKPGN